MKMRFPRPLLGLALLSTLSFPVLAQVQDGPAVNWQQVKTTVDRIKKDAASGRTTLVGKVISDFRNAASNNNAAIALYQSALMATKNEKVNDVQDMAKMIQIQNAARIHLNYLVLTIQHNLGASSKQLVPALEAHVANVIQAEAGDGAIWMRREKARQLAEQGNRAAAPNRGRMSAAKEPMFCELPLMTKSVKDSPFVQWYGIQYLIAGDKNSGAGASAQGGNTKSNGQDWEMVPGNIDGIYQATLLPYYRQAHDPKAIAYWDQKIQQDAQTANSTGSAFEIDKFTRISRPKLLWSRAKDEIAIGLKNRGIADMLDILKLCPDHPDLAGWISEVEGMIPGAAKPADAEAPSAQPAGAQPGGVPGGQ